LAFPEVKHVSYEVQNLQAYKMQAEMNTTSVAAGCNQLCN